MAWTYYYIVPNVHLIFAWVDGGRIPMFSELSLTEGLEVMQGTEGQRDRLQIDQPSDN